MRVDRNLGPFFHDERCISKYVFGNADYHTVVKGDIVVVSGRIYFVVVRVDVTSYICRSITDIRHVNLLDVLRIPVLDGESPMCDDSIELFIE